MSLENIKEEYLKTMRRFERGEDVNLIDVFRESLKYFLTCLVYSPRSYIPTLIRDRMFAKSEIKRGK